MAEKNVKTLGRYELLALLATGGMAEIHLARQTGIEGFERLVVVKKILPHLARDDGFLTMFFDEARIASQLNHPNIVQIYDLGKEGDEYFIAMEHLEGESLGYLVREARRTGTILPTPLAAGIIAQVCDGLEYAHTLHDAEGEPLSIVHRDVSPQNIIVLFSGGVKIVDFGIAKAASQVHETRVGTMKGKISYMSPEQCLGKKVDPRTDVFSLGIVLWELLTRRRLYKRDNEAATLQAVLAADVPRIREIRPQVAPEFEELALRALQKDPAERFASAAGFGAALREYLRTTGAAAGVGEIATFVSQVFGERARTKKRLLDKIRRAETSQVNLEVLKPDTKESMPSRSRADASVQQPVPDASVEVDLDFPPVDEPSRPPPRETTAAPIRRVPVLFWVLLPVFAVIGGLTVWYLVPHGNRDVKKSDPLPPDTPSSVDAGVVPVDAGTRPVVLTRLSIRSRPDGCQAQLDGLEIPGRTPFDEIDIEPGRELTVAVLCPKHKKEVKKIRAKPGERVQLLFAPKSAPGPSTGKLRLDTQPWTEVYLGKRKLGITPLLGARLKAGKHSLTLVNESKGIRKVIQVTIRPGKTTTLHRNLQP